MAKSAVRPSDLSHGRSHGIRVLRLAQRGRRPYAVAMAIQTTQLVELQREERRILAKFDAAARRRMARDGKLSYAAAFNDAVRNLPNTYRNYCECREALAALHVRPLLVDALKLGKGPR